MVSFMYPTSDTNLRDTEKSVLQDVPFYFICFIKMMSKNSRNTQQEFSNFDRVLSFVNQCVFPLQKGAAS